MKTQSIFALALASASTAFAQVGQQTDGQPTASGATTISIATTPAPATGPAPVLSFTTTAITEADHTETITVPVPSIPTSGFTTTTITVGGATETIPIPVAPSDTVSSLWPYTTTPIQSETSPYIPPNPPVPTTGFTSSVISEAGATETVPVPLTSFATSPVAPTTTAAYTTAATSAPSYNAAAMPTAAFGMLAGALGVAALL